MRVFKLKAPPSKVESYDIYKHGIHQSTLQDWLTCREKSRLSTLQGWRSTRTSLPLVYGSIMHGAIECWYSALREARLLKKKPPTQGICLSQVKAWVDLSVAKWEEEQPKPLSPFAQEHREWSAMLVLKMFPRYMLHWWKEDTENCVWHLVEDKFTVPLKMYDGRTVPLIGTYDAAFTRKGKPWLLETKNKSQWSDKITSILPLDLQLGVYLTALGCDGKTFNMDPVGARYNLIRRPGERQKKEESLKDYAARIAENVDKDPDHYFQRFDIQFTKDELTEHRMRTHALCNEFYLWVLKSEHNKRDLIWNSGACENKYGTCSMLEICSSGDYSAHRRSPPR